MITFIKENWRRFRAPSEKGRVLAWPWAMLAVAVVSVFHGVTVTVCAAVGWLWRQVWPRRTEGLADDGSGASVFNPAPVGRPSGAGSTTAQAEQQLLAAQLRAEREQAWADEEGFLNDCDDDESMFDDEDGFGQQHHPAHRGDAREGGRRGDYSRGQRRQHHQHRQRQHGRHGCRGRRGRHRRNGRHGQGLPQLRLGGRGGVLVKLCA